MWPKFSSTVLTSWVEEYLRIADEDASQELVILIKTKSQDYVVRGAFQWFRKIRARDRNGLQLGE
jgi:hypothetical protein